MNAIIEIQKIFLEEATASPMLLSDLAIMEKYISESYTNRALIELLQNADDAQATNFYIERVDEKTFVVANNGREFTEEDITALCRSGVSTKKRKANTIGFRGIGFKSVVNFSKSVHIQSGTYRFSFSKVETQKLLNSDMSVPLIRIPHTFLGEKYTEFIESIVRKGYTTVFVFEVSNSELDIELELFDTSCLLFLRYVKNILFDYNNEQHSYNSQCKDLIMGKEILLTDKITGDKRYLLFVSKDEVSIAFEIDSTNKILVLISNAVVHSFMPTKEKLTLSLKINGDFSSDPSRTRVIYDEETKKTLEN